MDSSTLDGKSQFVSKLLLKLSDRCVLYHEEDLYPYECDALTAYKCRPWIAVLPENVEQVQYVLKLCGTHAIPIVARGAGTGLSGGALPVEKGVLLNFTKLNKILEIDPVNRFARVQPGVRNLEISHAAAEYGLFYAPDPSSQIACTIGGNIAENSGGVHCLKYGLTVHNLLALKMVTANGDLVEIGTNTYDTPGYELLPLITGSEGMLGIIVEATVKLLSKAHTRKVLLAAFSSIEDASNAVASIIGAGIIPAGLEMMDQMTIRASEAYCHAGYPTDAVAILLCEIDGIAEEVQDQLEKVQRIMLNHRSYYTRSAETDEECEILWRGRKSAFPALGKIAADYYCMDGTIPRKHLAHILENIQELSKKFDLSVANVFHAGDGNLHPLILYDANKPDELRKAEELGGKILELCIGVGGTITGEHGVGVEKLNQMCVQFTSQELNIFHNIKNAFDPHQILNPGKAVPTLHRCAEFGAMHVHGGNLPHPELPRF